MKRFLSSLLVLIFFSGVPSSAQKFERLASLPPMGWNSWNYFGCDINEALIREIADAMVSSGMKEAGYEYVVIDDCWQVGRDTAGNIIADPERFPSGIPALADYVHSKGLKFGIYSDAGTQTCQERPGSRGYEFRDARTYARWGVDYLKYDWCHTSTQNAPASYALMRDALYQAGRPVVFSICEWGIQQPWLWADTIGHLYRISEDIKANFLIPDPDWSQTVTGIIETADKLRKYNGPDHWNDLDMLEVGNPGLSVPEARFHFSMWCMLSAPLMAGNDLRNMTKETRGILTNREVIALDQDPLGLAALKWIDYGKREIWLKPLANGDYAICFTNAGDKPWKIEMDLSGNRIYDGDFQSYHHGIYEIDENFRIRDLWLHKEIGTTREILRKEIPAHDILLIRLIKNEKP